MTLLVDKEGVPLFVQKMRYRYSDFTLRVTYFDGLQLTLDASYVPTVGIMQNKLTRMQELEAERVAEAVWHIRKEDGNNEDHSAEA